MVAGSVTVNVLPPSNRPPTATAPRSRSPPGGRPNVDLSALVTDPDPGDTLQFASTRGGGRRRCGCAPTARRSGRRPGSTQAGRTDSFGYTVTDSARRVGDGHRDAHRHRADAPPPQARPDTATTNQATPVTIAVLANDIDPSARG